MLWPDSWGVVFLAAAADGWQLAWKKVPYKDHMSYLQGALEPEYKQQQKNTAAIKTTQGYVRALAVSSSVLNPNKAVLAGAVLVAKEQLDAGMALGDPVSC